jgi:TRAP-type C4-dicarboxylate transport system permease small subunit
MAVLKHIESLGKMVGIIFTPMVSMGLIGLALVVIYNAMVRFLPISPNQMAWTEEIGRLLLLWIAFVGAGLITRDEKHFVIDIFTKKMGNRLRSFCRAAGDILMISFLVLLIWETVPVVLDQMGQMTSGAVELPLGIFSLSLLVGSLIMLFYVVTKSILDFRSLGTEMTANKSGQE